MWGFGSSSSSSRSNGSNSTAPVLRDGAAATSTAAAGDSEAHGHPSSSAAPSSTTAPLSGAHPHPHQQQNHRQHEPPNLTQREGGGCAQDAAAAAAAALQNHSPLQQPLLHNGQLGDAGVALQSSSSSSSSSSSLFSSSLVPWIWSPSPSATLPLSTLAQQQSCSDPPCADSNDPSGQQHRWRDDTRAGVHPVADADAHGGADAHGRQEECDGHHHGHDWHDGAGHSHLHGNEQQQQQQLHHHEAGPARKTFFNIVISIVGAGVLGLPYTFMRSGWLLGSVAVAASALLSYHCMMLLVVCRRKLAARGHLHVSTYGDVGLHACGALGQQAVDVLVLVSQGGCCVAYLIFIAENLSSILFPSDAALPPAAAAAVAGSTTTAASGGLEIVSGGGGGPWSFAATAGPLAWVAQGEVSRSHKVMFILLAAPFQVLLAWVRSLTGLAPFSMVADVANVLAMAVVLRDDLHSFTDFSSTHAFTGAANVPFAIGVAIYCYEGFAMTLPLESSMKNRARFPSVLALAFAAITALYIAFGLVGYAAFKDGTREIITLNLPNDWSTVAVKLGLCTGLFFTFPVMMQPVHEIFERRLALTPAFQSHVQPSVRLTAAVQRALRAAVVGVTTAVAIQVPGFAKFISLVGSTVCAMLAFVLPAVFHLLLVRDDGDAAAARGGGAGQGSTGTGGSQARAWWRANWHVVASDCALIMFGVAFACYGTFQAVRGG